MAKTKAEVFAGIQKHLPCLERNLQENALEGEKWTLNLSSLSQNSFKHIPVFFETKDGIAQWVYLYPEDIQDLPKSMERIRLEVSGKEPASPKALALLEAVQKLCD